MHQYHPEKNTAKDQCCSFISCLYSVTGKENLRVCQETWTFSRYFYLLCSKSFFTKKKGIPDSSWPPKLCLYKFRALTISEVIALFPKAKLVKVSQTSGCVVLHCWFSHYIDNNPSYNPTYKPGYLLVENFTYWDSTWTSGSSERTLWCLLLLSCSREVSMPFPW